MPNILLHFNNSFKKINFDCNFYYETFFANPRLIIVAILLKYVEHLFNLSIYTILSQHAIH